MAIRIHEVVTPKDRRRWVGFQYEHYRGDPTFVPQLISDELDTMSPEKNPAFQVADTRLLMAFDDNRCVGRVCGIIHRLEAEKLGWNRGRFGWFEAVEDPAVSGALLGHLEEWFRAEGCREMAGPLGFTDLDPEGLLIEAFDTLPTIAGSYNKPYYEGLLRDYGLEKEVDYKEFRFQVPEENQPVIRLLAKKADRDREKYGLRSAKCRRKKDLLAYIPQFWELLEKSFAQLYGVTPLTQAQVEYYTKKYFGIVDPDFVQFVVDEKDRMVGFYLGIPSLSRAFQRAGGRLLPLGFLHILRAFKTNDTVDFLLAGVDPDWTTTKVLPTLAVEMYRALRRRGIRFAETNHELETNTTVTGIWSKFDLVNTRHTRVFRKSL